MNKFLQLEILVISVIIGLIVCKNDKGLTWKLSFHDYNLKIDKVYCFDCNAYSGDTKCSTKLPILCYTNNTNLNRPPYYVGECSLPCYMPKEFYWGWSGGMFFITEPYLGTELKSPSNMDQICTNIFGKYILLNSIKSYFLFNIF